LWSFRRIPFRPFFPFQTLSPASFAYLHRLDATRNHFDLRLQLDNETISWAIPKGLTDPAGQTIRYAIETVPHHLNYSLLEGSVVAGRSTTGCWDLGTYTVRLFPFFSFFFN
jgi:hypothetical protein